MSSSSQLTVVGLTGGIASGKSTVARMLRQLDLPVVDADELGRMVLEPDGSAYERVLDEFGASILSEDGRSIDRQKLGGEVFDDSERRALLEGITHPEIAKLARRAFELVAERGKPLAIYEAALIVETGLHRSLDALAVVSCSVAEQMERLGARDDISREAAAARIASQFPLDEKTKVADYVVDNSGDLRQLRNRVGELAAALEARFAPEAG
jgi:dephospho-CoA kinase